MKTPWIYSGPLAALVGVVLLASPAAATTRHFVFTHQSGVLAPGDAEFEPWTTLRVARDQYYSAVDERLEFELGVLPRLQTSVYWNFSRLSEDVRDPDSGELSRASRFSFDSLSSEWKYQLSDPVADALGSALYFEASYGPEEAELEERLILDKRFGSLFVATNLVAEQEWEYQAEETETEQLFEGDVAAGYFITPSLVAGGELVSQTLVEDGEIESSVVYLGPSLAVAAEHYWLSVAVTPQLLAPKGAGGGSLDLTHGERLRARVLLGFHL